MKRLLQTIATPMLLTVVLLAAPGTPHRQDFFHTRGGQIVDSRGRIVRLAGVSWWGMETDHFAPLGLDKRPLDSIMAEVRKMGFNVVRLPYSNQMLQPTTKPTGINYELNTELKGLSSLQVMDRMIASARTHGLRVILDRHRPDATQQTDLWYTPQHTEQQWINDWMMLAARYRETDTVVGFDLHNEPHGSATWGTGDAATDWRLAAERAGNAVLSVNPHLLILVEGISNEKNDSYWWGGNLSAAGQFPVRLSRPQQLVYSAHDYPPSVAQQGWFKAADYPKNLPGVWTGHWGYLVRQDRVPVVLGEFGTHYVTDADRKWMGQLVDYLAEHRIGAMYWSLNPESTDTGGLLGDDWRTVDHLKLAALQPLMPGHSTPAPVKTAALTVPAIAPNTIAAGSTQLVTLNMPTLNMPLMQAAQMKAAVASNQQHIARSTKHTRDFVLDLEPKNPLGNAPVE
jgi:aryl-phospho-beta-D-glucosidase BglC (GH1 family)